MKSFSISNFIIHIKRFQQPHFDTMEAHLAYEYYSNLKRKKVNFNSVLVEIPIIINFLIVTGIVIVRHIIDRSWSGWWHCLILSDCIRLQRYCCHSGPHCIRVAAAAVAYRHISFSWLSDRFGYTKRTSTD